MGNKSAENNPNPIHSTEKEEIEGIVETIRYQHRENGYAVTTVDTQSPLGDITVVGILPAVYVGVKGRFFGEWKQSPKYGTQFSVSRWEEILPVTLLGIENYLASGLIRGIGPVTAKRIVETFGLKTLEIIEADPKELLKVPGIGKTKLSSMLESWGEYLHVKRLLLFLQEHEVSPALATKIYKTYQDESIAVLQQDPYLIIESVPGVGFKTADTLAMKLGYDRNDPRRAASGLFYTLTELATSGHVYANKQQLLETACQLLGTDRDVIETVLEDLLNDNQLIQEEDRIYHPMYYHSEVNVANRLINLSLEDLPDGKQDLDIDQLQQKVGITYDEVQIEAIHTAMRSKVMVLTGGPGTGKTTTTQGIIAAMELVGRNVVLAAPTGRAAKRMSEATGHPASTIHRLLEFSPSEGCKRNQDNPLEGDILLVDECSMIDLMLMNHLIKAIPSRMRLILIGDTDQLPSIGAGNILRDIIASDRVPVVRLTRIFRQAQTSRIIMNAHAINQGHLPNISNGRDSDFFFLPEPDNEKMVNEIVNLITTRLPNSYGYSAKDMQVLTPMRKGVIGTEHLNLVLQEAINPTKTCLRYNLIEYRLGDRVMQIRNNYQKDVYNGDMGYIQTVDIEENKLSVLFDNKKVVYEQNELDELQLAYACTIHKSQGSEFPVVIMPVSTSHYIMLQRNLIYTGITRAKRLCIMMGTTQALSIAVQNNTVPLRNSQLKERIIAAADGY